MTDNTAPAARFTDEYIAANRIQFNDNDFQDGVEGADPNGTPYVHFEVETGTCACGCGLKLSSTKRNFLPGHDQRLMGILVRAHRESLEVSWMEGGFLIGSDASAYGQKVLTESGVAKLERYLAAEPKRARKPRGSKAAALGDAVRAAVLAPTNPLPKTVKIGRWEYPVVDVERDGNGKVVSVTYKNRQGADMVAREWGKLS